MAFTNHENDSNLLLSIVVPVYNTEKYVGICLDSLLTQDVPKEKYEIICIDDGSTDQSAAILGLYQENNSNITVFCQKNAGVSAARNKGIESARGKYVWFVDSDDFVKKNSFSGIMSVLEETDCDCLSVLPFVFAEKKETVQTEDDDITDISQSKHNSFLPTKIIRKSIIIDHGIRFAEGITYYEDHFFSQQVLPYIKKQKTLEKKIYYYRLREGSASSQNIKIMIFNQLQIASLCKQKALDSDGSIQAAMMRFQYQNVSSAVAAAAGLPGKDRKPLLRMAASLGVFPLRYSKKYTPNSVRSFHSAKKRILRRLNDYSYLRTVYALQILLYKMGIKK